MNTPDTAFASLFTTLLSAIQSGDYASFIAAGDSSFQKTITQDIFDGVSSGLSPQLVDGFDTTFLDHLSDKGALVLLWKISFHSGADERLARLCVRDGHVTGFRIASAFA